MRMNSAVSPICSTDGQRPNLFKTVRFHRHPQEQRLFQFSLEPMLSIFVSSIISFYYGGGLVGVVLYHSFQWDA